MLFDDTLFFCIFDTVFAKFIRFFIIIQYTFPLLFINAKIYLLDFYSISFLEMKSLQKFICFFLALQLFSLAQSTHD